MSDDGRRDNRRDSQRLRALQIELQTNRRRMLTALAEDYQAVATRLGDVYSRVALVILDKIKGFPPDRDPALLLERLGEVQSDFEILAEALANADGVMASGAQAGARVGVANLKAGGMGVAWGVVDADQVLAGMQLVDDGAYRAMIGRYAPYHAERVRDVILDAISRGKNPRETAELLAGYFEGKSPLNDALRIARTSQLYAARRGVQVVYQNNGVERWMWSANLGNPRTCLACVAMHGTIHPSTETLNDHWLGRCAPLPITPRWEQLGILDADEREPITGVAWFEAQNPYEQQRMMGAELYQFWREGLFDFNPQAVVGVSRHPVFGDMRYRKANWEIIGVDSGATGREVYKQIRRNMLF